MHSIINKFVANNISFVLNLLCYCWSSFHKHGSYACNHGSYFHRVFTWLLLIVGFCFFFGLCLRVFSFALHFWWMGSHPWILYTGFLLLYQGNTFALSKPNPYSTLFSIDPLFNTIFNWPIIRHDMGLWPNLHSLIITIFSTEPFASCDPVKSSQVTNSKHIL